MQSIERFVVDQLAAWEVPGCAVAAEVVVALRGDHVLTVAIPGAPPFELEPAGRGLRFGLKGQPAVTAEFELDESGHVARLVAQPLGIFQPKP